jgi:peptidoglycan/LPS O-acetylase OafA/YrhL
MCYCSSAMAYDAAARPEIPSLTGMRFIAAFLVALAHTDHYFAAMQPAWLDYAWRVGANIGMTTFFVLSGFVIHYNYGSAIVAKGAPAIRSFLVARFARLYPLYLLTLLIVIALVPSIIHEDVFRRQWVWRYLTMTQDWTPTLVDGQLLATLYIGSAWSISAEVGLYTFYLLAAASLAGLQSVRAALGAIAVLTAAGVIFFGGYAAGYWFSGLESQNWWLSLSPLARVPEFLLGALTAQLYVVSPDPRSNVEKRQAKWLGIAGAVWLVGSFLACYIYINFQGSFGFAPGIAAVIFFLARYRGRVAALVETPIVVALGDASYSIYMLHGSVLFYVMKQSPYVSPILRFAMAWGLTVFLSLGVYRYFEAPARRLIRRWAAPGQIMLRRQRWGASGP